MGDDFCSEAYAQGPGVLDRAGWTVLGDKTAIELACLLLFEVRRTSREQADVDLANLRISSEKQVQQLHEKL
jgi:hypothetical protein